MTDRVNSPEARDTRAVIHGLTNLRTHLAVGPLLIESGDGVFVRDSDGRDYIEGMAGLWCVSLGYSETRLIDAARRQLATLPYGHLTDHKGHTPVVELAWVTREETTESKSWLGVKKQSTRREVYVPDFTLHRGRLLILSARSVRDEGDPRTLSIGETFSSEQRAGAS